MASIWAGGRDGRDCRTRNLESLTGKVTDDTPRARDYAHGMSEVTQILSRIDQGDPTAGAELLPLVYDELRKLAAHRIAREQPGQTLQATALVHEAYLRLVDAKQPQSWDGRGHFFSAAAEAMRRILVDSARQRRRTKHGGEFRRVPFDSLELSIAEPPDDLLEIDEALTKLSKVHPDRAELIRLRFFAGLTNQEAAQALGISATTAERQWTYARAWLLREVGSASAS